MTEAGRVIPALTPEQVDQWAGRCVADRKASLPRYRPEALAWGLLRRLSIEQAQQVAARVREIEGE